MLKFGNKLNLLLPLFITTATAVTYLMGVVYHASYLEALGISSPLSTFPLNMNSGLIYGTIVLEALTLKHVMVLICLSISLFFMGLIFDCFYKLIEFIPEPLHKWLQRANRDKINEIEYVGIAVYTVIILALIIGYLTSTAADAGRTLATSNITKWDQIVNHQTKTHGYEQCKKISYMLNGRLHTIDCGIIVADNNQFLTIYTADGYLQVKAENLQQAAWSKNYQELRKMMHS
ncbi:MAG: hypothetical protein Tsb005_10320 [Gammaproteobacteria bacterium]